MKCVRILRSTGLGIELSERDNFPKSTSSVLSKITGNYLLAQYLNYQMVKIKKPDYRLNYYTKYLYSHSIFI